MNIIIVGAGEIGLHLARILSNQSHDICVIESSEGLAAELDEQLDAMIVASSGASVSALAEARVDECDLFFALTSDDNTNLVSASMAKSLGAKKTVARVHFAVQREEWLFNYREHFGVDYLFSPERLAAVELAKFVRNPEKSFVEELARGRIELQQTFVSPNGVAAERTLKELGLPARVRVAVIQRHGESLIPTADEILQVGDLVTIFGEPNQLHQALPIFQPTADDPSQMNIVIYGGGEYGFALAQSLEGQNFRVRIIEKDKKVCLELSETLHHTVVLNGDATSLQLLREERVGEADFFIAASRDDEDNVMTCLQAKSLGTRYCLALVQRGDYADIISHNAKRLGILGAVSPRVTTGRDLLRFVTEDKYHIVMNLFGGVVVIETVMRAKSRVVGTRVCDLKLPQGSGLVAILRGEQAFVPAAADSIEPGDTVYAIVAPEARKAAVKLLTS
jgi:trk system potassium uptake protein TrkA